MKSNNKGFTLIELLVVISILTLLSSIVIASARSVHEKSKVARVYEDLNSIRSAIVLLGLDTGKWPNGCPIDSVLPPDVGFYNEIELDEQQAGLEYRPTVAVTEPSSGCGWTAQEVAAWKGPYVSGRLKDPWGSTYWFDNDYEELRDCPTLYARNNPTIAAIASLGPNKVGGPKNSVYDCDDITFRIY